MKLASCDRNYVVRLAKTDRKIVEHLHFRSCNVDQLVILRMKRSDRIKSIDRKLIQRDYVFADRLRGFTLHRIKVTDIVVDVDPI